MLSARFALVVGVTVWLSSFAHADVLVVDPGGGGGAFTALQGAVDAAAEGDVILVQSDANFFESLLIDGKSVHIVVDTGFTAKVRGLAIENLGPDESVVVRACPAGPQYRGKLGEKRRRAYAAAARRRQGRR